MTARISKLRHNRRHYLAVSECDAFAGEASIALEGLAERVPKRTPEATRMVFVSDSPDGEERDHLPLVALWNYSSRLCMLSTTELVHIWRCDDCLSLLAVCHSSESLKTWSPTDWLGSDKDPRTLA